jgi:D-Tyr-tRNAtyr deacylase
VLSASVTVDKVLISSITQGILVLAAVGPDDTEKSVDNLAAKILLYKLWDDLEGGRVCKIIYSSNLPSACHYIPGIHLFSSALI